MLGALSETRTIADRASAVTTLSLVGDPVTPVSDRDVDDDPEGDVAAPPGNVADLTARLPRARPSGVKAVLARLPFELRMQVPERVQPLITKLKHSSSKVDTREVVRAFICVLRVHEAQVRDSGDPSAAHPLGVADILADLGMDTPTMVAALLHDVVEDTDLTVRDLATEFGDQAAELVEGVNKLGCVQIGSHKPKQAESLRKMLMAIASDYRVLLIKLADRLHNMRTIHHLPRDRQEQVAKETLEIYAPLAHRLGLQHFKWQLEDLAFATMYPKRYDELRSMVRERQPERDRYIDELVAVVGQQLRSMKIRAEIGARPRHLYAIYERMVRQEKELSEIFDRVGIRVIVDSVDNCYAALGTIHARWHPVPGRFKDYIAMPKFNLYQSLHTTVVGPAGRAVEVQIRTHAMQQTAEYGIAAHWRYHDVDSDQSEAQWLAKMIDMQSTADAGEIVSNLRRGLNPGEVVVFTPRGDAKELPRGSTPVDFAYAVHTDVGNRTLAARINGLPVALDRELRNGETVEIVTSKASGAGPNRDWLRFVRSSRARNGIKQWFSRDRRDDAVERGWRALRRQLARQRMGWQRLTSGSELATVAVDMGYGDVDTLCRAVENGDLSPQKVAMHLLDRLADEEESDEPTVLAQSDGGAEAITVPGADDVVVNLAQCCTPVLGDDVLGFVTRARGVSVHRQDCSNAEVLRRASGRVISIAWDTSTQAMFRVTVQVIATERPHLLRDITTVLGDLHVNILSAQITTQRDRIAKLRFTFELVDIAYLDHIITQISKVEAVHDAFRVVPRRMP